MSSAREQILGAIRQRLGRDGPSASAQAEVDARLQRQSRASLRPKLPDGDAVALFRAGMEKLSSTLAELADVSTVPSALIQYRQGNNLDGEVVIAPALRDLDWQGASPAPRFGRATGDEQVGVSLAFCGIVETGSLVLLSGSDTPTTLNFLPEHHLVVLYRNDLVAYIEDVWTRMRNRNDNWPRTVNIITGPSRTADIEQTIQLGAHGPRRLHVLLVQNA